MHGLSDGTPAKASVPFCHAEWQQLQLLVTFLQPVVQEHEFKPPDFSIFMYDPHSVFQAGYEQDADARGQEARNFAFAWRKQHIESI